MSEIELCVGCEVQYLGHMYEVRDFELPLIFLSRVNDGTAKTVTYKGVISKIDNDKFVTEFERTMNVTTKKRGQQHKVVLNHNPINPNEITEIVLVAYIKIKKV